MRREVRLGRIESPAYARCAGSASASSASRIWHWRGRPFWGSVVLPRLAVHPSRPPGLAYQNSAWTAEPMQGQGTMPQAQGLTPGSPELDLAAAPAAEELLAHPARPRLSLPRDS